MKRESKSILSVFMVFSSVLVTAQVGKDSLKSHHINEVKISINRNTKSETSVLQEVKKSVVQKQSVGAEELSRKAISNVEQSLVKVSGINAVENRGIFVRGLEERYNYLLINGLGSPSNNPFQKIIALKQFPTDVVGKLNIYKTFQPNLYGDFAGATFDIETLSFEKSFSKIEFGVGYNSQTTFKDFFISPNANQMNGYLALHSKKRQMPHQVRKFQPSAYTFGQNEAISAFGEGWNVNKIKALPNTNLGFTTAQRMKLGSRTHLGVFFSLNQGQNFSYRNGNKDQFLQVGSEIIKNNDLTRFENHYETESSLLFGLGLKSKKTSIMLNAMYLQNSTNIIDDYWGYRNNEVQNKNQIFRVNQQDISRFTNLQLLASQKLGERHEFRAGASWINNSFQQPDRKVFNGVMNDPTQPEMVTFTYGGNNLIRQYLDIKGNNYLSAFAEYHLGLGGKNAKKEFPLNLTFGYNGFFDNRVNTYRFIFGANNQNQSLTGNINHLDEIFHQSLQNGDFTYRESAYNTDWRSFIYQFINAGFFNINYKPNEKWNLILGGRLENNLNISRYKDTNEIGYSSITDPYYSHIRNQNFFLPSLSVKYAQNQKINWRFSLSKTITRPILIEYIPLTYINPDNENILGNKNLTNSENFNADLKFEFFPTGKEMFSVNFFAKEIKNAIERSFTASGNSNGQTITFFNAQKAQLFGLEVEAILGLKRISEVLSRFSLGTNATIMHSDVTRNSLEQALETDNVAGRKRQLQGAAPWIFNVDLKYEKKNKNQLPMTISAVYNVSGRKINTVGFNQLDNIYEKPFHQLDLVYSNQINKNWNVKFSVKNVLNSMYSLDLGEKSLLPLQDNTSLNMSSFRRGVSVSASVGYTF